MSFVGVVAGVAAAVLQFIGAFFVNIIVGIVNIGTWFVIFFSALFNFLFSLGSNGNMAPILVVGLAVSAALGPPLVSDINIVWQPLDFIAEGLVRPSYEIVSKTIAINGIAVYEYFAEKWNAVWFYITERTEIWWLDITDIYNIISSTGDYLQSLSFLRSTWTWLSSWVLWFWNTKSVGGKSEYFYDLPPGAYFFEYVKSTLGEVLSFEMDPTLGAFPREDLDCGYFYDPTTGAFSDCSAPDDAHETTFNPNNSPDPTGATYYLRNFFLDLLQIVQLIGDFAFGEIEQFAFPGQKLVFNFIIRVENTNSSWRKIADIFTRILSFLAGSSFYPKDGNAATGAAQSKRLVLEFYLAHGFRAVADVLRAITLIIVHAETVHFPDPLSTPVGVGVEYLITKLKGVPGVDPFLDLTFTSQNNVIIVSKYYTACQILVGLYYDSVLGVEGQIDALNCDDNGGVFTKVLTPQITCPLWDGASIPTPDTRIDYVYELWLVVPTIEAFLNNPTGGATFNSQTGTGGSSYTPRIALAYDRVVYQLFKIIYSIIYYVNSQTFYPQCGKANNIDGRFFADQVDDALETVLSYAFYPRSCGAGYTNGLPDPFTCFVALSSQAANGKHSTSIWYTLCSLMNAISFTQDYYCTGKKRSVSSEEFAAPKTLTMAQQWWLRGILLASDTRKAYTALETCVFAVNSTARSCSSNSCAIAPCIDESLDCIAGALPSENTWHTLLTTNNNTNVAPRNVVSAILHASDFLRGCADSYLMRAYQSIAKSVAITRSFFMGWTILSTDYVPSLFTCMSVLRNVTKPSTRVDDAFQFASCLGYDVATWKTPENTTVANLALWSEFLDAIGVHANESRCAFQLHRRGIVIEDVANNESLSLDHLSYRICTFQFAFGSRAVLSQTTQRPLREFLDAWQAIPALMDSLAHVEKHEFTRHMRDVPEALQPLPIKVHNSTAAPYEHIDVRIRAFGKAMLHMMPALEILGALFHYYADVHDLVAIAPLSPEEKASLDAELWQHHIGVRKRTAPEASPLLTEFDERKREISEAIEPLDSRISIVQEFGRLMYWAGKYPTATGATDVVDAAFEFAVDLKPHMRDSTPLVYIRPRVGNPNLAFSHSNVPWSHMPLSDFEALIDAFAASAENSQQKQLIAAAVNAYKGARSALVPHDRFGQSAAQRRGARDAINLMSTVVTSVWRLINRRLRVEGFPAFHAAMLMTSILTSGKKELHKLPAWMKGNVAYLPGAGFVDNDQYAQYIANEQHERKRAMFLPTYYSHGPLYSAKRAKLMLAQAQLEFAQKQSLMGEVPVTQGAYYERQKRTHMARVLKRHTTFADRSAFLLRHNMHEDDEVLHLVAPEWWRKRTNFDAPANTTESRQRYTVLASAKSGDFLGAIDDILHTLGAPPNVLETALVKFEMEVVNLWDGINDPMFLEKIKLSAKSYLASLSCDYYANVAASGTQPYKLFCFPNLPERAFSWYLYFPENRNLPLFGYFQDAGYIRWPPQMILQDCPTPRVPILQYPPPVAFLQQHATTVTFAPGTYETTNGQSVPVYPVDTTSILGNVNITDWCKYPGANSMGERPYCPTFDYCTRVYYSPDHFGFTNGGENLIVIFNDIRFIYANAIANNAWLHSRLVAIFFLFLLLAFKGVFGTFLSYGFTLVLLYSEFFITLTPENWAYVLIWLWFWLLAFPVVAWLQWAPFVLYLYLLRYFNNAYFLTTLFADLPKIFPDTLAISFLRWLASVEPISFFGLITFNLPYLDSAVLTSYADSIVAAQTHFPATELNNVMTVAAYWNLELLILEVLGFTLLAVLLGGSIVYFFAAFFPILPALAALSEAFTSVFVYFGLASSVAGVEDLHVEVASRSARLASDVRGALDSLRRKNEELAARVAELSPLKK